MAEKSETGNNSYVAYKDLITLILYCTIFSVSLTITHRKVG
jgi:hypothetical protein